MKTGSGSKAGVRRLSAAQRKAEADLRSPEDQLARLDKFGMVAKKERAKLAAKIAARSKAPAKKAQKPAEVTGKVFMVLPKE